MIRALNAIVAFAYVASPAMAQDNQFSSSSREVVQTPVGQVNTTSSSSPVGNGTFSTKTVSPGDGSSTTVYGGAHSYNPNPNKEVDATTYSVGVQIPFGDTKATKPADQPSSSKGPKRYKQE